MCSYPQKMLMIFFFLQRKRKNFKTKKRLTLFLIKQSCSKSKCFFLNNNLTLLSVKNYSLFCCLYNINKGAVNAAANAVAVVVTVARQQLFFDHQAYYSQIRLTKTKQQNVWQPKIRTTTDLFFPTLTHFVIFLKTLLFPIKLN